MHLHISTIRRGTKTYRYAQLVESYRRESDGKPTLRVIASLGALDDVTIENLRQAFQASREGAALVLKEERDKAAGAFEVVQNLRYLDLAVLLRLWEDLGLRDLVRRVLPDSDSIVDAERIIAALVLHRCVEPGSKLAAERWYPSTVLPELTQVVPSQFNNSRLHRTLGALEGAERALQDDLPRVLEERDPGVARLFIDATDTWFVGQGPPLAAKGVDKEGVYRRRIGIVLLCDQRGYPLRWETLGGHFHDGHSLLKMAAEAARLPWLQGRTVVIDRAVGTADAFEQLVDSSLVFLTALPGPEIVSSKAPIPWDDLAGLQRSVRDPGAESVDAIASKAGFKRVTAERYVLDLGVFERARSSRARPSAASVAMQLARYIEDHRGIPTEELAKSLGRSKRSINRDRRLCRLIQPVRERVVAGEGDGLQVSQLAAIALREPGEQVSAFEEAILHHPASRPILAREGILTQVRPAMRARGVLCFNPAQCAREQASEAAALLLLDTRVARINQRLSSKHNHRKTEAILGEIGALIRKMRLADTVFARVESTPGARTLVLDHNEQAWAGRRRCHGVMVLTGHAEVQGTPAELVELYYSKDHIEKDFQAIKSVIEVRPVRHRTDAKVRAHVTLCMLALLLTRALKARLAGAEVPLSASAALEVLHTAHLNHVHNRGRTYYTVTTPTAEQHHMVRAMGMTDLLQDEVIRKVITPR